MKNKIYIAGKITGDDNFKAKFRAVQEKLEAEGNIVLNPAELPEGMQYEDYMRICFAMIDVSDEINFIPGWTESKGAVRELNYAKAHNKPYKIL